MRSCTDGRWAAIPLLDVIKGEEEGKTDRQFDKVASALTCQCVHARTGWVVVVCGLLSLLIRPWRPFPACLFSFSFLFILLQDNVLYRHSTTSLRGYTRSLGGFEFRVKTAPSRS